MKMDPILDRIETTAGVPGLAEILAQHADGVWIELADGGVVDWTQRLLSSAKERLVISGIGGEWVCTAFEA